MNEKFKEVDISSLLEREQEAECGQKADCSLGVRMVLHHGNDEQEREKEYVLQAHLGKNTTTRKYMLSHIAKRKFLQDLGIVVHGESEFHRKLRREILQMDFSGEYISHETYRNGLQTVNGKRMYVFGNGAIDAVGFHTNIKSSMEGIYFPIEQMRGKEDCIRDIEELFGVYKTNPPIFYPLFFLNIMGITNGYFREIGEDSFMRLSLWLDGASGSGKTELAKAGTYIFGDKDFDRKVSVSVTGKRKDVLTMLLQSSGGIGIVDDVKQEGVRERRNGVRNNIDDCLRSVFQGFLTDSVSAYPDDKKIDCCTIITGEYLETQESQNARLIYIRTDGFLKNERNAQALRRLQEQPKLLAGVCGGYIRFLLGKMDESSFSELLKVKLREMRSGAKIYQEINNAERLNENRTMLEMSAWLTEEYFRAVGMQDAFINEVHKNATKSIEEVMDATFYLLGGGQMLFLKTMKRICSNAKIRKASYCKQNWYSKSKYAYHQECFWINEESDDFVWIGDYKESMCEKGYEKDYGGDENPVLLIRKERLKELLQKEIRALSKEKAEISSKMSENAEKNFWKMMREMRIIYQIPRSDSELGRSAVEYPVFRYFTGCDDNKPLYVMKHENVVQINTEHPYVEKLAERAREAEPENVCAKEDCLEIDDEERGRIEENVVYEKRRKFMRKKSLYKK